MLNCVERCFGMKSAIGPRRCRESCCGYFRMVNTSWTARRLRIGLNTLRRKLKDYGVA